MSSLPRRDAEPKASPPRPARRVTWWTRTLLAVIAVMCLAGLWVLRQWHRLPEYWVANQAWLAQDNATLLTAAQNFERQMFEAFSGDPDDGAEPRNRLVRVDYRDLNAWLHLRLADWCAHQNRNIPQQVNSFMFASESGHLVLAFRYQTREIDQVASLLFDVQVQGSAAHLRTHGLRAGMLPVPVTAMTRHLQSKNQIAAGELKRAIDMLLGQGFEPTMSHPGHAGRALRLVALDVGQDAVVATVRSESRRARAAAPSSQEVHSP